LRRLLRFAGILLVLRWAAREIAVRLARNPDSGIKSR
jgi:hypothetical protein